MPKMSDRSLALRTMISPGSALPMSFRVIGRWPAMPSMPSMMSQAWAGSVVPSTLRALVKNIIMHANHELSVELSMLACQMAGLLFPLRGSAKV